VLETIGRVKAAIGCPCAATADAVIASIAQSVELVRRGEAAALCTDPI
jgi:4-hydroxy-L-threonine phosphate dehydrogenase PdxA